MYKYKIVTVYFMVYLFTLQNDDDMTFKLKFPDDGSSVPEF